MHKNASDKDKKKRWGSFTSKSVTWISLYTSWIITNEETRKK